MIFTRLKFLLWSVGILTLLITAVIGYPKYREKKRQTTCDRFKTLLMPGTDMQRILSHSALEGSLRHNKKDSSLEVHVLQACGSTYLISSNQKVLEAMPLFNEDPRLAKWKDLPEAVLVTFSNCIGGNSKWIRTDLETGFFKERVLNCNAEPLREPLSMKGRTFKMPFEIVKLPADCPTTSVVFDFDGNLVPDLYEYVNCEQSSSREVYRDCGMWPELGKKAFSMEQEADPLDERPRVPLPDSLVFMEGEPGRIARTETAVSDLDILDMEKALPKNLLGKVEALAHQTQIIPETSSLSLEIWKAHPLLYCGLMRKVIELKEWTAHGVEECPHIVKRLEQTKLQLVQQLLSELEPLNDAGLEKTKKAFWDRLKM